MTKTVFSSQLFEQIGGVHWQVREEASVWQAKANGSDGAVQQEVVEQYEVAALKSCLELESTQQSELIQEQSAKPAAQSSVSQAIVVLGHELDSIWQNDEMPEWQLWRNIMAAFNWDESDVFFYDLAHIVTEEMGFAVVEEVIDMQVEWLLSMDDEHFLTEQLSEGVQVVHMSSLETMLGDPFAKQQFYRAIVDNKLAIVS